MVCYLPLRKIDCWYMELPLSAPPFLPPLQENTDETCVPGIPIIFKRLLEASVRSVDLLGQDHAMDTGEERTEGAPARTRTIFFKY